MKQIKIISKGQLIAVVAALAIVVVLFILLRNAQSHNYADSQQLIKPDSQQTISASTTPIENGLGSTTSSNGTISQPSSLQVGTTSSGQYYVYVSPDQYYKNPGSSVIFSGSHFIPGEIVLISYNGETLGSVQATAQGAFITGSMAIPYSSGKLIYTFTGSVSKIPFPVTISVDASKPWVTLDNYYAGAGSSITISGHGFGSHENVQVNFEKISQMVTTNDKGEFILTVLIPATGAGKKIITAVGMTTGAVASQSFSQAY